MEKIKKRYRIMRRAMGKELREHRSSFIVFSILRALVVLVMVLQVFNRNYENVFLCGITLVLLLMPSFVPVSYTHLPHG